MLTTGSAIDFAAVKASAKRRLALKNPTQGTPTRREKSLMGGQTSNRGNEGVADRQLRSLSGYHYQDPDTSIAARSAIPYIPVASYSAFEPRSQIIRLIADVPPSTLPRDWAMTRSLSCGCGIDVKFQSYFVTKVEPLRPGMLIRFLPGAEGPDSITRMVLSGIRWPRRAATAFQAVPPPTTTKSQVPYTLTSCRAGAACVSPTS